MIFAFYGSLRPGMYNYERFQLDKLGKHLNTVTIPGYKMYSVMDWYPKIFAGSSQDTIVVDIVEINDRPTVNFIEAMERGAGYKSEKITIGDIEATLYVGEGKPAPNMEKSLVPSGDWVKYDTERTNVNTTSK